MSNEDKKENGIRQEPTDPKPDVTPPSQKVVKNDMTIQEVLRMLSQTDWLGKVKIKNLTSGEKFNVDCVSEFTDDNGDSQITINFIEE